MDGKTYTPSSFISTIEVEVGSREGTVERISRLVLQRIRRFCLAAGAVFKSRLPLDFRIVRNHETIDTLASRSSRRSHL